VGIILDQRRGRWYKGVNNRKDTIGGRRLWRPIKRKRKSTSPISSDGEGRTGSERTSRCHIFEGGEKLLTRQREEMARSLRNGGESLKETLDPYQL